MQWSASFARREPREFSRTATDRGGVRVRVWLTRSEPGASRQAALIEAGGHACLVMPVLDVEPLLGAPPDGPFDIVIFLSEHAVRLGLPRLRIGNARVLAVGARTATVLDSAGVVARHPARADSEGLLDMPALTDVHGSRVLLVCGAGGREMLGPALVARGAHVARFICYERRARAQVDIDPAGIDAIVASSAEGLAEAARIWFAAGGRVDVPVLVPSARAGARGVALGFRNVHDCQGPDAAAVLRVLGTLQDTGAA
jgi:uroporphyrinogen-III synthase